MIWAWQRLGIDEIIYPELLTARENSHLLRYPKALEVEFFADGKVTMLCLKVEEGAPAVGVKVKNLGLTTSLLVGVIQAGDLIIPTGETIIHKRDRVYLLGLTEEIQEVQTSPAGHDATADRPSIRSCQSQ